MIRALDKLLHNQERRWSHIIAWAEQIRRDNAIHQEEAGTAQQAPAGN